MEQMNAFKKSNGIQNGGNLKGEIENAVDNIKEVEMKQNVFQNSNINQQFQRINSTLENHEGRIGVLEGTVAKHGQILANHEGRIGKLENTVDLHSKQLANHERRIGHLEGTVAKHGQILVNHEKRIGHLEGTVTKHG